LRPATPNLPPGPRRNVGAGGGTRDRQGLFATAGPGETRRRTPTGVRRRRRLAVRTDLPDEFVEEIRADGEPATTVAFGAPERGLPEILGIDPESVGADAGSVGAVSEPVGDDAGSIDAVSGSIGDDGDIDGDAGSYGDDAASSGDERNTVGEDDQGETGRFDLWLNTVPAQGSEVVRTEEAVFATLAPLSLTE